MAVAEITKPSIRFENSPSDRAAEVSVIGPTTLAPETSPARRSRKRVVLVVLGGVVLAAVLIFGTRYGIHAYHYESTDDAFVESDIVPISTKLPGYVASVLVRDNQHVEKGDLIVKLDSRDQDALLAQAQALQLTAQSKLLESKTELDALTAGVAQAKAEAAASQANADYAHTELKRYETMENGAASPQERSNALSAAQAADANVQAAASKVTAAQANMQNGVSKIATAEALMHVAATQVQQAELNQSYATITAPLSGRITRKNVEQGSYLQVGQSLLAIVPETGWIVANFKETQLANMRPGQPVDVYIDAYPAHPFRGHVDSMQAGTGSRFSLLPPENATGNYVKVVQRVPVKIVLDEKLPDGFVLAPGMSVVPEVKVR